MPSSKLEVDRVFKTFTLLLFVSEVFLPFNNGKELKRNLKQESNSDKNSFEHQQFLKLFLKKNHHKPDLCKMLNNVHRLLINHRSF